MVGVVALLHTQVRAGVPLPWLAFLVVVLLGVLAEWWPLEAPVRRGRLSTNLYEAAVIVGLTLLPPVAVPLAVTVGVAISLVFRNIGVQKWSFNVAMHLVSTTVAALTIHGLVGAPIDPTEPRGVTLLVVAGVVFGTVNGLAMTGLLYLLRDREGNVFGHRTFYVEAAFGALISIALGVLLSIVLVTTPWALPLAMVPIIMTRRVMAGGISHIAAETAERERLERTIAGASEGICLLDRAGTIELLNPAAVTHLGTEPTEAVGRRLDELLPTDEHGRTVQTALAAATPETPRQVLELTVGHRILSVEVTGLFDRATRTGAVVLLHDVTEAREAESMRQEFLARVSHELRTPLTAIVGFAETLHTHTGRLDAQQQRGYLEVIQRQGHRLGRLVDDLLWSSRMEAGKVQVTPDTVPLRELLVDVEAGLRPVLQDTPLTWDVGGLAVRADARHVEQVLTNLITNAITYGVPPVTVTATADGDHVVIDVIDEGPGVRASFVPQLFTAFEQESIGDRREARGLGLGLAIVASLVEQNHGTIAYRREQGRTVFRVTLPGA